MGIFVSCAAEATFASVIEISRINPEAKLVAAYNKFMWPSLNLLKSKEGVFLEHISQVIFITRNNPIQMR